MVVCFNKFWYDVFGIQIDDLGVGVNQVGNFGLVIDGNDLVVGDCDCFGCWLCIVDGEYGFGYDEVCIGYGF